jgi:tetratricopeptide (TPR) repeat protein
MPGATREQRDWYNELQRVTVSPEMAHRIHEKAAAIDVEDMLPRLRVPTLVMHAARDAMVPVEHGRAMAKNIPGARFLELDSANHLLLAHEPVFATFLEEARQFLSDPEGVRQSALFQIGSGIDRARHYLTVLAVEVMFSVQGLEKVDPESATRENPNIYNRLVKVIEEYGGIVTSNLDGTVTAAFGFARATEDHAYLACRAALAARLAIQQLAPGSAELRAGIDTGEVIVRQQRMGNGFRIELEGAASAAASHLMLALQTATIAATDRARAAAGDYVQMQCMKHSEHPRLGKNERAFELLGENQALSRWHLRANRGLTRFIARDAELKSLLAAWRRTREGYGQVIGISADAGLGKSRLAHEFLAQEEVASFTVLESGGFEFETAVSLGAVKKLVLSACGVRDEDTLQEARARLLHKQAALGLESHHITPLLFVADLPVEDEAWQQVDSRERAMRIREAVNACLVAMSRKSPVALLIEDLHWIDAESEALLNRLVETIGASRICLVVTYRPHYQAGWGRRSYFQQIRLERFVREETDQFLDDLLGSDPSLREVRLRLVERAEGMPLFLEEAVRTLAASGVLTGKSRQFQAKTPVDTIVIPPTIQSAIAARIQQLGRYERQILQIASVVGRSVCYPVLRQLAPEAELESALATLQDQEFLFEAQSYPHVEYMFKHALTLDVAYESLLSEDRTRLHKSVLSVMEKLYMPTLNQHVEELAEHAFRAERWDSAARYLLQAAVRAEERSAPGAAVQFLENARKAVAALPRTPETLAQAIDLRVLMRPAYGALGEYQEALQPLLEARDLAVELGDPQRISDVLLHLSYLNSSHGRYEQAVEPAETLRVGALAKGIKRCVSEADLAASQAHLLRSEARQVLERLLPHEESFTKLWRHERFGNIGKRAIWYLGHRGQAEARLGLFCDAERTLAELRDVAKEVSRPTDDCAVAYFAGVIGVLRGPDPALIAGLRECVSGMGTKAGILIRPWLLAILGHAEFMIGEAENASTTLETAITEAEQLDMPQFECHARAVLACVRAQLDEPEAPANLDHALTLARGRKDPWSEIVVLRGLAAQRSSNSTIAWLEEACARASETELRPELARSLRALGLAQRRAGLPAAELTLAKAEALYREMQLRDRHTDLENRAITESSVSAYM